VIDGLELAERALAAVDAEEAEALVHAERSALARFAASEVHQPTLVENAQVQVRVVREGASGWASTNRISPDGLADVARRAAEGASSASPDPDYTGLTEPEPLPDVEGYDEETAALSAEEQARLARAAIDGAAGTGAYGYFTSGTTLLALASTTGLRAEQRMTDAGALVLAAGEERSGFADATSWRVGDLDPAAVGREAAEKAARTTGAREIEPAHYAAVLEPYAVADLLAYFAFDSLSGLGLLEGRSYLTGRLGERLFDPKLSLADDPLDPRGLPKRFDFEGTPKRPVALVESGVARGVVWDRRTAARADHGQRTTGHAPPPEYRSFGPQPLALRMDPGDAESLESLCELVGDGIYVTRLHYLSVVDSREGIVTGMTRDGTFRIRDGRPAEPLVNLRFTTSVPQLLAALPGIGRELKLVNQQAFYDERYPFGILCPALATAAFSVTGVGSGPGL
jgi:PmbA protein